MGAKNSVRLKFGWTVAILLLGAAVDPQTTSGAGWSAINTGLPGLAVGVNSLVIDPASPSTIYAQTVSSDLAM